MLKKNAQIFAFVCFNKSFTKLKWGNIKFYITMYLLDSNMKEYPTHQYYTDEKYCSPGLSIFSRPANLWTTTPWEHRTRQDPSCWCWWRGRSGWHISHHSSGCGISAEMLSLCWVLLWKNTIQSTVSALDWCDKLVVLHTPTSMPVLLYFTDIYLIQCERRQRVNW